MSFRFSSSSSTYMGSMLSAASPLTLLLPCQDGSKYLVEYLASKSFLCHLAASVAINVFGEDEK